MPQPVTDPHWLKLALALIQAGVGATSALIAVLLTQRFSRKDSQLRAFQNLSEPFIGAHATVFKQLVILQDEVSKSSGADVAAIHSKANSLLSEVKTNLIWLDDLAADALLDTVASAQGIQSPEEESLEALREDIVKCQRMIREVMGVPEYREAICQITNEIRRK